MATVAAKTSGALVLAYHMVDPAFDWGITRVKPGQFARQMHWLAEHGFQVVDLEASLAHRGNGRMVAITFDDAYESIYHHAFPVLQCFNWAATVFVITSYVGQYNSWDANIGGRRFKHLDWHQLRVLKDAGWRIESHSATHVDLTRVSEARCQREIVDSKQILAARLGTAAEYFSYPFGKVNAVVAQRVAEAGFKRGFVLNRHNFARVAAEMQIPRTGIYLNETLGTFQGKLQGHQPIAERIFQRLLYHCAQGTSIYKGWLKQKRT